MNTGSNQFENPDKLTALSESLLKQGIAKTKLDADRMAEGMMGKTVNTRPAGQKFHFGFEDDKRSNAKIDNYSGPSTLPEGIHKSESTTIEPTKNRFLDTPNLTLDEALAVAPTLAKENANYDAFESLKSKVIETEKEIFSQKNVIDELKTEIANLKQTHQVFHSKMEELHNKVGQQVPQQKPFVGDSAVSQLDTMMQQPVNLQAEYQEEEQAAPVVAEIIREVEQAEGREPTPDELIIQKQQESNPVPKQEVVDIDLNNIFGK